MNKKERKNIAASVRQRLFNKSKERKEDFQYILNRFALERLLYRLSVSNYSELFVLKGASLFIVWGGSAYRPTMDIDLLGIVPANPENLKKVIQDIISISEKDDGLAFDIDSVHAEEIRENKQYGGVRVTLVAYLDSARIPLQVDIGFGDAITPSPEKAKYPSILNLPSPELSIYPKETVVAEKFETMVVLGMLNSRMRDFYDLWSIQNIFPFDSKVLQEAIRHTFSRRRTFIPEMDPVSLSEAFYKDPVKQAQWNAFVSKGISNDSGIKLDCVIHEIHDFIMPLCLALSQDQRFDLKWPPGGPWK
ncbi:MAG: nucleotidyl transferase AbiEii/AbiGii toxin family protein [Pseudomonadota bacterium]|nr:nucleotidyl transferase AbiEii/AbiGii toxin family protein [Patescibacteria group bacterium]